MLCKSKGHFGFETTDGGREADRKEMEQGSLVLYLFVVVWPRNCKSSHTCLAGHARKKRKEQNEFKGTRQNQKQE